MDELLRRRPGLGSLAGEARVLRDRLAGERGSSAPGASSLTAAELRLLGAASRSRAVTRSRELGLLEG